MAARLGAGGLPNRKGSGLGELRVAEEHCRLVAVVDERIFLPELELETQHDPPLADARPQLAGFQTQRRTDACELLEISAVDAASESGPSLVPAAAVKEPCVKTAEAARRHHHFGARKVCGMTRTDPLLPHERQLPSAIQARRDAALVRIHAEDLVDQEGTFSWLRV